MPIKEADIVVIAIGEDVGASIITTALMKQYKAKQIIGRSINPIHRTVLESIGIETIFNPEEIAAEMNSLKCKELWNLLTCQTIAALLK